MKRTAKGSPRNIPIPPVSPNPIGLAPRDGPPMPGASKIQQEMMVPICITDMIMNSFIPFATFFMRTGIPAKLATPTKNTTITSASDPAGMSVRYTNATKAYQTKIKPIITSNPAMTNFPNISLPKQYTTVAIKCHVLQSLEKPKSFASQYTIWQKLNPSL